MPNLRSIGVIGGGTAGYFTAIALKKRFPELEVTLVESSSIPVIGVGEATTPPLVPFLHHVLGIDICDFFQKVLPTFKLGIKFFWGLPGEYYFNYAFGFGEGRLLEAQEYTEDVRNYSLTSMLMAKDLSPVIRNRARGYTSLLSRMKFAYHLDNRRLVKYLQDHALSLQIPRADRLVDHIVVTPDGQNIDFLSTSEGQKLEFDLYVDCTGFRSRLIEHALGSPFLRYDSSLYCDTALVANVPHGGFIKPYTLAESMNHGWCWNIPQVEDDHRGYVFSSAFCNVEQATAEMRTKNPAMTEPWTVKFRSGRHEHFWKGNVVAVGNSYAFVEPLESTALHMVILEVQQLIRLISSTDDSQELRTEINAKIGAHWDYLRWFLALHYRFNRKFDTPFWNECRRSVDYSGLEEYVGAYNEKGLLSLQRGMTKPPDDAVFGLRGIDVILFGQNVAARQAGSMMSRKEWDGIFLKRSAIVARALPLAHGLALLRESPNALRQFAGLPSSWCAVLARHYANAMYNAEHLTPDCA